MLDSGSLCYSGGGFRTRASWTYVESNRIGDHICYYSDLTKMKAHYPDWGITKSLKQTVAEIAASWSARLTGRIIK